MVKKFILSFVLLFCLLLADEGFKLPRILGKYVGFENHMKLDITSQGIHTIKTLSIKPLIFEIDGFLSNEECEYLIYLAKSHGLRESATHPEHGVYDTSVKTFTEWDVNNDSFIDSEELTYIKGKGDIYLTELETMKMMDDLQLDKNHDNKIDINEFFNVTVDKIFEYFRFIYENNPRLRSRTSKQSWLWHYGAYDTLLEGFHERLSRLTKIPHELIEMSEPMQVVHYEENGHYHCHHDSDDIKEELPCCTHKTQLDQECRLCRYLTLLIFLNNVTSGGETAFPVANNDTFDYNVWSSEAPLKCNLADNCDKSNLVVQPKKGKALLWYNHKIDNNGWFGELDPSTYHGGCDVLAGDKWVANTWINIIGEKGSKESQRGWLGIDIKDKKIEL